MTADLCVIDTSVLISAMLSARGRPAMVVDHVVTHARILFSQPTFEELATRVLRPKFDRYLQPADRDRFVRRLAEVAIWTTITGTVAACRDPNDDKFLETARAGRADCIVTGDHDLLVLDPFAGIPIITPAVFISRFMPPPAM